MIANRAYHEVPFFISYIPDFHRSKFLKNQIIKVRQCVFLEQVVNISVRRPPTPEVSVLRDWTITYSLNFGEILIEEFIPPIIPYQRKPLLFDLIARCAACAAAISVNVHFIGA